MKEPGPDPNMDSLVGRTLDGKYLILEQLGSGGMGAVFKGRHIHLNRDCAIKVIRRHHAGDPVALKRFKLEAEAASQLKHPNVIDIYDFGIDEGQPYIVMELISGCSLDDLLGIQKFLHYELAIPILIQVCDALAHAHEKKVLHRDLKPGNIMILNDNDSGEQANSSSSLGQRVKLVDFGIAKLMPGTGKSIDKLTATGELFGSPLYMSPEQCMGQSLDNRSDIYALGCVMYETLTGKLPLVADSMIQVVMKHINEMPPRFAELAPDIAIPEKLESLVFQCLAKERALRFATVKELRKALSQIYTSSQFSRLGREAVDFEGRSYACTVRLTTEHHQPLCGTPPVIVPWTLRYEWVAPAVKVNSGVLRSITCHAIQVNNGPLKSGGESWRTYGILLNSGQTFNIAGKSIKGYSVRRVVVPGSGPILDSELRISEEFPVVILRNQSKIYDLPLGFENKSSYSTDYVREKAMPRFPSTLPDATNDYFTANLEVEEWGHSPQTSL